MKKAVQWITIGCLFLTSQMSFASVSDDMNQAVTLSEYSQKLHAFEESLAAQMTAAQKRELMYKNDVRAQQGRVDMAQQDVLNAQYETHQQRNINAELMRQIDAAQQTAHEADLKAALTHQPQTAIYGYGNGGSNVVTAQPRQITMLPDGLGLTPRQTTITIMQPEPIVKKSQASLNHEIRGDDFNASLVIPEDTSADTLQVLKTESGNITDRYREKLTIMNDKNVMDFNAKVFELKTSRTVSIMWALIPLVAILAGSWGGLYVVMTNQKHKRVKLENHILEKS